MFDSVVSDYGSRFLLAAGGVGLGLIVLIGVLWLMRNRAPSPFVRGGKNRQPRLQVLDAAAVDTRRRLVLVRRDDVEHLIMIGGPSDIVIESRILPEGAEQAKPSSELRPAPVAPPAAPVIERRPAVAERPALRAVPEQRPEPRVEPKPEPVAIFEEEEVEPDIPAPAPAPAPAPFIEPRRPQPIAPAAAAPVFAPAPPAPAPTPAISVPPVIAAAENRVPPTITVRPIEQPQPAPSLETTNAADILDAARARVLPQQTRIEPEVVTPPAQSLPTVSEGHPVVTADAGAPPQQPKGDFQRILEEEMNTTLAAERVVQPVQSIQSAPIRTIAPQPVNLQRRDPEAPPVTGADAELQKEVARIFGEMSVNRDK